MMRIPLIFPLCMVALLSGCQQNLPQRSARPSAARRSSSSSSVAAGTRYLKNKCNRSDLPADETIYRAAVNVGKARGWGNIDVATLSQNSDRLYQQLYRTVPRKPHSAVNLIVSSRHLLPACAATKRNILSAPVIVRALFLFRLLVNFSARPVLQRREGKGRAVEAEDRHILLDLLHHQIGQG